MAMTLRKSLETGVVVDESRKTKKARKKLQERLDRLEKRVTPEALKETSQEISRWIERHASDRVVVSKDLSLFDRNKNPAKPSRGVEKIVNELTT